jgi:hypothetical protein
MWFVWTCRMRALTLCDITVVPCTQVTNLYIDISEQMQSSAIRCACSKYLLNRLKSDVQSQVFFEGNTGFVGVA